jgi:3-deoxy-D-manno-octulosonic-acid transferase
VRGFRIAYNLAVALGAGPVLAWKSLRDPAFRATVPQRLGRLPEKLPGSPVWIHGASVGEMRAVTRVVERLDLPMIVSTMTPAGLALARSLFPRATAIAAPLDLTPIVSRALDRIAPRLLVIVETEIWPELIVAAAARGLPVAMVSARISDRTTAAYRRARAIFGPALRAVAVIGAQTETDRERLIGAGADPDRVWVTGNLKFDAPAPDAAAEGVAAVFTGSGPWLVAGSTHAGEEASMLEALAAGRAVEPKLKLVIAPRHLARLSDVEAVLAGRGVRAVRRSSIGGSPPPEADVIVLDTMGELDAVYAHARIVFVGGSLVPVGGHNVLEPARHGRPILMGPYTQNFRAETDLLLGAGAARRAPDAAALAREVRALLADPARAEAMGAAGRRALEQGRGATERTMKMLAPLLGPDVKAAP